MKQCEFRKYLSSYLDNQLNPLQESQVEEHLPLCHSCKEEWEELRKLKKLCAILPEEELPNGFHQQVLKQIEVLKKSPRKYTWIQRVAIPVAAALFIFIAGKYGLNGFPGFFKSSESKPEDAQEELFSMATHEADDSRALTSGEASKDDSITMDNVADERARQEDEALPDSSSVKPEGESNKKDSDYFNFGLQASEELKAPSGSPDGQVAAVESDENGKAPANISLKFGIGFTTTALMIIFLFHIAKRKR